MKEVTYDNLPAAAEVKNNEGSRWAICKKLNQDLIGAWNAKRAELEAQTITQEEWNSWIASYYNECHQALMDAFVEVETTALPGPYWNSGRGVTLANCLRDR